VGLACINLRTVFRPRRYSLMSIVPVTKFQLG
jgi:hypothetical protein